ncbi:MAG: helix-turn-helix transcriptional regulator [Lachnospiraceae bacterium]|nr:helix-turn-helix transcriptional regulator [Lachnospiraceae bacterium]
MSYRPFWETLKKKQITQYQLIHTHNFSTGTLDALRKGRSITLNTLQDICRLLSCTIPEVVEFLPDPDEEEAKPETEPTL